MTKKKAPEELLKMGRPSKYTPALTAAICDAIATATMSLKKICDSRADFPDEVTIFSWLRKYPDFYKEYMLAKEYQQHAAMEEAKDIVNDISHDMIQTEKGWVGNPTAIARASLKVRWIQWHASKLAPKIYGDKMHQEISVVKHEDALKELE